MIRIQDKLVRKVFCLRVAVDVEIKLFKDININNSIVIDRKETKCNRSTKLFNIIPNIK